ncbi:MAG: ThiF family adenylyltransferase [Bryobacteraceae bacterium]|nr:ThiF family adenylyltransferase [Bryobacterales bacterium]MEB2361121.1 ThiF family adenylyltransferase [Bryobacterales bacterium]NUM99857.1 ThiF family adenylyltransferase [Bryobacteraceae bacterium]
MTPRDSERYSRQIRFAPLGQAGQERLFSARVAVVGCGALGSFHAEALARAGVGNLLLVDRDYLELSNLQRQWLYDENDVNEGLPKAVAAARKLAAVNSGISIRHVVADLTPRNIEEILEGVSLILDGSDNFEVRYLINDFAVAGGIPWVYGAAVGSYGLTMPVIAGSTACLKCIYPSPPEGAQPTCETAGVLNTITSVIASLQVAAAMRILCGEPAIPRITTVDVWTGVIRQVEQPGPQVDCECCGRRDFIHLRGKDRAPVSLCGRNAVQIHERTRPVDLQALQERLAPLGLVKANEFALRFFITPYEMTVFPDGRAIIKGTQDTGVARSLYSRYLGN